MPKADTQYAYASASQQQGSLSANVDKQNAHRLVVDADVQENALGKMSYPLYLYDAATRKYQEIKDGEEIKVQPNEHGRYFLTQTRSTAGMEDAKVKEMSLKNVKIYSPVWGVMILSKPGGTSSNRVEGYTLDGKKVSVKDAKLQ